MTMTPPMFRVLLDDGSEHVVQVLLGDQLRAELEAPKHALPVKFEAAPAHHTALWLWAALTRMGVTDEGFRKFRDRMHLVGRLDDAEAEAVAGVDPTPPAPGTA